MFEQRKMRDKGCKVRKTKRKRELVVSEPYALVIKVDGPDFIAWNFKIFRIKS